MSTALTYRPDIDGLRALAVVPVLLYHAGVPGFTGGFVGVDVFFVVSGFLITSIIMASNARAAFRWLASTSAGCGEYSRRCFW
ncbi:MAG: acyltransferase family protein [Pseudomonadota bacterium]